nr:hypothetical protein [Streptomyces sp. FT05W]
MQVGAETRQRVRLLLPARGEEQAAAAADVGGHPGDRWTKRFLAVHEPYWTITSEIREIAEG